MIRVILVARETLARRMTMTVLTSLTPTTRPVSAWWTETSNTGAKFVCTVCDIIREGLLEQGDILVVDNAR
jgi:hypothetical protein